jgi:hypothetical protein
MKRVSSLLATIGLAASTAVAALGAAAPALAQEQDTRVQSTDRWTFVASPYLWMSGLWGKSSPRSPIPPADVDISFKDVLDDLSMSAMLMGEARKGRFGLVADFAYVSMSDSAPTPGALFTNAKIDTTTIIGTGAIAYRVYEEPKAFVDTIVGFRVWSVGGDLKLSPGLLPGGKRSLSETWADPIVGVRARYQFTPKIGAMFYGDVGSGASRLTGQVMGLLQYQITPTIEAALGYRYLTVDYTPNNGFVWDVDMHGPMLGTVFRF